MVPLPRPALSPLFHSQVTKKRSINPAATFTHMMAAPKGTIVVTGANGSLGSAIAAKVISTPDLASFHQGVYAVRDAATATTLDKALASAPSSHKFDKLEMDLSRLSSVREAANDLNRRVASGSIPPIRALILNAGYMEFTVQTTSEDGFDMTFQCNYLSHWLFTLMLLQSMDKEKGRVVVVGSWAHESVLPLSSGLQVRSLIITLVFPARTIPGTPRRVSTRTLSGKRYSMTPSLSRKVHSVRLRTIQPRMEARGDTARESCARL